MVNLVGNEQDAALPAKIEQLLLILWGHHPTGGVARRIDVDRLGVRLHGGCNLAKVQAPAIVAEALAYMA